MKALCDIFVNGLFQNVQIVFVIFEGQWLWFRQFRNVICHCFWYNFGKSECCVSVYRNLFFSFVVNGYRNDLFVKLKKIHLVADTSLFGSSLSLSSNSALNCVGGRFQLGLWAGMILVSPGGTESVSVEMIRKMLLWPWLNCLWYKGTKLCQFNCTFMREISWSHLFVSR